MSGYDGSIKIDTKIDTKNVSSQMLRLENQISKAARKASELTDKMQQMENSKIPTEDYKDISDALHKSTAEFDKLLQRQQEMIARGKTSGAAWDSLDRKIEEVGADIRAAEKYQSQMVKGGTAYLDKGAIRASDAYQKLKNQLRDTNGQMQTLAKKQEELAAKENKVANSANKARRSTGSWLDSFSNKTKRTSGLLHNLATRLRGITLSLFIFNWITKGWNAMVSAVKDGTQNMAKYSSDVNAKMSQLTSAVATLKNALGALSAPIISAVGPALTYLINMLTAAINKVNQFISALTGKTTWTKATTQVKDYAAGLDKASGAAKKLKGQLQSFNELNNISSNDGGSGGAGGGSGNVSDMFEELPIDQGIADLAEEIKNAIKSGDWEGLGQTIRDEIASAVGKIKWRKIYKKADQFGVNFAKFLNGLFSEDKKGNSVFTATADVIAGALNTALHGLDGFASKFKWKQFGTNLAGGCKRFFEKWDAQLTGDTFSKFVNGILSAIVSFVKGLNDSDTWATIMQKFVDFLGAVDFKKLAINLSDFVSELLRALKKAIDAIKDNDVFTAIGQKIADFICSIDFAKIDWNFAELWTSLKGALLDIPADFASGFVGGIIDSIFGEDAGKKVKDAIDNFYNTPIAKALRRFTLENFINSVPAFKAINDFVKGLKNMKSISDIFGLFGNANESSNSQKGDKTKNGRKKSEDNAKLMIKLKIATTPKELWEKFKKSWGENRKVQFLLFIASKAKELWETFKKSWGESKYAKFLLKIGSKIKELWENFKERWGESKTATFLLKIASKIRDLWDSFKNSWGEKRSVSFLTKNSKDTTAGKVWSLFKTAWGSRSVSIGISFAKNALSGLWNSLTSFFSGKKVGVGAEKKAGGGIYTGGMWHNITAYATGTENAPAGQLFVAREAGPELVGTLGGHTAVVNNDQIVASVSDGVARAVRSVIGTNGSNVNVIVKLEGDANGLFKMTQQKANEYFRATGNPAFAF